MPAHPAGKRDRFVEVSHTIDAPREHVYRMWTHPDYLKQWYSPRRCTLEVFRYEFRVGGFFQTGITDPEGRSCLCAGHFDEIVEPERIVYTIYFCDEHGEFMSSKDAGADPAWPDRSTVTVTFSEVDGRTRIDLLQTVPASIARQTGAYQSWLEMLERLEERAGQER